jgi:ribosome-associated protein
MAIEQVTYMRDVEITHEPVELYKILKFEGLLSSGAEAKNAIAAGMVEVNGESELRKRRKIVAGDLIVFQSETLKIVKAAE